MEKRNQTSGFTLVELLVVIGLIAVLIAMLLPSLAKARAAARQVACAANMRQLGSAMSMYGNDWNGAIPLAVFRVGGVCLSYGDQISTYLGVNLSEADLNSQGGVSGYGTIGRVFLCPSDADDDGGSITYIMPCHSNNADGRPSGFDTGNTASAGIGVYYNNTTPTPGQSYPWIPWKVTQIRRPSETLLLVEKVTGSKIGGLYLTVRSCSYQINGGWVAPPAIPDPDSATRALHNERFNYLFVDGHVEFLRPVETVQNNRQDLILYATAYSFGAWTPNPSD